MIETIALVLYVACLAGAVFMSLSGRIHLSLLILVPLLPLTNILYRFHKFPCGKDFTDIITLAMLVGWVLHASSSGEKVLESTPLNKVLIFMGVFSLFSFVQGAFYLHQPLGGSGASARLQTWKNYMMLPLLYFIAVNNIKSVRQMKWLLVFMMAGSLLMDFYTSRQIRFTPSLASRDKLIGTFVYLGPNQLAAFYVQWIFVLAGIVISCRDRFWRIASLGKIGIGMFITLFLYSRGAYLAIIAGAATLGVLKKRILLVPLVIILATWSTVLPKNVVDRINETHTQEGTLDSSSQHRIELWKEAMGLFMSNPVSGIGFDVISQRGLLGTFKDTHNIFMKYLAEQGLIGTILLLMIFWISLKVGYRLYREAEDEFLQGLGLGFVACVIANFVCNMFGDRWTFLQVSAYFWVFLAMVVRGIIITEEEQAERAALPAADGEEKEGAYEQQTA